METLPNDEAWLAAVQEKLTRNGVYQRILDSFLLDDPDIDLNQARFRITDVRRFREVNSNGVKQGFQVEASYTNRFGQRVSALFDAAPDEPFGNTDEEPLAPEQYQDIIDVARDDRRSLTHILKVSGILEKIPEAGQNPEIESVLSVPQQGLIAIGLTYIDEARQRQAAAYLLSSDEALIGHQLIINKQQYAVLEQVATDVSILKKYLPKHK